MTALLHTGTLRIEEFALAGDGFRECGIIDIALDIECYEDEDWSIARVGFVNWNGRSEQTWWLSDRGIEGALLNAILLRAKDFYADKISEFARAELEVA